MSRYIVVFCLSVICLPLLAADHGKATSVSPWLYKKLTKTEKQISQKSYAAAQSTLQKILADVDQGSYEQATVLRSLSSVYALQGKYRKAASTLKKCLNLNVLPNKQKLQSMLNLGQLYMATEQYALAVSTLAPWLAKNPNPDAEISALLANAYAQLKKYRKALPHIKKAIAKSRKPPESWYQLNLALYYELKNYQSAADLLTKLIRRNPDRKAYWEQLASVYQQLKKYKKALSIQHLAFKKGLLSSEKDILALANLYLYIGSPYKGAALLNDALKRRQIRQSSRNWETLANAWQQAKEFDKAVSALEKASSLNEKGSLYRQLGQIFVEQEKWQQAIKAFNQAIAKGGVKQMGSTYLLLGMSHYELNNLTKARQSFNKASRYPKQRKASAQWLDYIKSNES